MIWFAEGQLDAMWRWICIGPAWRVAAGAWSLQALLGSLHWPCGTSRRRSVFLLEGAVISISEQSWISSGFSTLPDSFPVFPDFQNAREDQCEALHLWLCWKVPSLSAQHNCESGLDMNETEAYVSPKGKPSLTIYQVLGVFRRRCCAQDRSDRVVDRGAVGIAGSALSFCWQVLCERRQAFDIFDHFLHGVS